MASGDLGRVDVDVKSMFSVQKIDSIARTRVFLKLFRMRRSVEDMTPEGAESYGQLLTAVQAHIAQLRDLLERARSRLLTSMKVRF